jgi:hypothetical protein
MLVGVTFAATGSDTIFKSPRLAPVDPPKQAELESTIHRGVDFLVERQLPKGCWGSARRTKWLNVVAPVPGAHHAFRTAVTSLCISALIHSDDRRPEVLNAIEGGKQWLIENLSRLRRSDEKALYNNWGHAYSISAMVDLWRCCEDDSNQQQALEKRTVLEQLIRSQIKMLDRYECVDGGWCYYDNQFATQSPTGSTISFVTATCLVALADARSIRIESPDKMVQKGVSSITRQRNPDFSYYYGEYLKKYSIQSINKPGGSLGRSQACNLAMYLWDDPKTDLPVMRTWLDRLFARNGWLSIARKRPIPHESHFGVAGYFYYYGHYYAARCIELLPEAERAYYRNHMAATLMPLQEKDGSWWDFPLYDYHQQYGTAMALMALYPSRIAASSK